MKEVRDSKFELMRIISMLFIVLWHIIMHGNMLSNCGNDFVKLVLQILQFIIIVHVNSFVLVSGYFQTKSKFKLSKLLALFLQVVFYLNLIFWFAVRFNLISSYSIMSVINNFLFSSINEYWFIRVYIIVYLFSDYINKFINNLSRNEYKNLLLILFLVFSVFSFISGGRILSNNGYNFYNFIFIYMIGGYLRKYPLKDTYHFKRFSRNGYIFFMIFIFLLMVYLNFSITSFASGNKINNSLLNDIVSRILCSSFSYSTPFVVIQTVSYFEIFNMLKVKSKIINFISSCTFGIYLFHDHHIIRGFIYKFLHIDSGVFYGNSMFLYMILIMFVIFVIGLLIEIARKILFYFLQKLKITKLLGKIQK